MLRSWGFSEETIHFYDVDSIVAESESVRLGFSTRKFRLSFVDDRIELKKNERNNARFIPYGKLGEDESPRIGRRAISEFAAGVIAGVITSLITSRCLPLLN